MNSVTTIERTLYVHGIEARAFNVVTSDKDGRILNQKIKASKRYKERSNDYRITVELRFDDDCGNGHETFGMTASIDEASHDRWHEYMGGCCHDEIAKQFPTLAPLVKWHLTSTNGPLHYVANTIYHAGNRDHNGLLEGEVRQLRDGKTGVPAWNRVALMADGTERPLHRLENYCDADTQPAQDATLVWRPWNRIGEGKERQLDYARSSAVWPDATDAELMQEPEQLKAALIARLPGLLAEFKAAMLGVGFEWPKAR